MCVYVCMARASGKFVVDYDLVVLERSWRCCVVRGGEGGGEEGEGERGEEMRLF